MPSPLPLFSYLWMISFASRLLPNTGSHKDVWKYRPCIPDIVAAELRNTRAFFGRIYYHGLVHLVGNEQESETGPSVG
jgi:hypothetical protein